MNYIINNTVPKSTTLQEIKDATLSDTILKKSKSASDQWNGDEKDIELKIAEELLTTANAADLFLKGSRIVMTKGTARLRLKTWSCRTPRNREDQSFITRESMVSWNG